jgi:hypothetical protein
MKWRHTLTIAAAVLLVSSIAWGAFAISVNMVKANRGTDLVLASDANVAGGRLTINNIGTGFPAVYWGSTANSVYIYAAAGPEFRLRPGNVGTAISQTSLYPEIASAQTLGAPSMPFKHAQLGVAAASKATCDSTTRGATMTVFATGGASDTFEVCMKAAADSYAWRVIYTAP